MKIMPLAASLAELTSLHRALIILTESPDSQWLRTACVTLSPTGVAARLDRLSVTVYKNINVTVYKRYA